MVIINFFFPLQGYPPGKTCCCAVRQCCVSSNSHTITLCVYACCGWFVSHHVNNCTFININILSMKWKANNWELLNWQQVSFSRDLWRAFSFIPKSGIKLLKSRIVKIQHRNKRATFFKFSELFMGPLDHPQCRSISVFLILELAAKFSKTCSIAA